MADEIFTKQQVVDIVQKAIGNAQGGEGFNRWSFEGLRENIRQLKDFSDIEFFVCMKLICMGKSFLEHKDEIVKTEEWKEVVRICNQFAP
jgi:hypothetical protein